MTWPDATKHFGVVRVSCRVPLGHGNPRQSASGAKRLRKRDAMIANVGALASMINQSVISDSTDKPFNDIRFRWRIGCVFVGSQPTHSRRLRLNDYLSM